MVWSKYVLYFLPEPERALAQLHRVLRPGGRIMFALNDWPRAVFDPAAPEFEATLRRAIGGLIHIDLVPRLPLLLTRLGFADVAVALESDPVYSAIGGQTPDQHRNLVHNLTSARPHFARVLGSEAAADAFTAEWSAMMLRPDVAMIVPIWFVSGRRP